MPTIGSGITVGPGISISSIPGNSGIYTSNMILLLDASNSVSYPGSGTVWADISGNNNNFNILSTAYNSSGVKYMDFNGSYGCAKNNADIALTDATGVTYCIVTRILNNSSNWRTLTRGYNGDHQVIIEAGAWNIGMYDNDGGAFLGTGYSQQSLPNYNTANWIMMYWRWQSSSPFYQLSYNDTPGTIRGSITNAASRYNRGFGSLGAYHNGDSNPANASQYWGDIAWFATYNAYLSDAQLLQNYNAVKTRYGI
jgi:hypothetical protein